MLIHAISAPWDAPLTSGEHTLIFYFLVIAALGFIFGLLRAIVSRGEVGPRYRTAVAARLGVMGVALASYFLLIIEFVRGYTFTGGVWKPTVDAVLANSSRYMEWSVSVPLLTVELLAVCTLVGWKARRTRALAAVGAFLMIFTGFIGSVVLDDGHSAAQLVIWGLISGVFWIATTLVLIRAVRQSLVALTPESRALLVNATWLLLGGWIIYPVVYAFQIFAFGGEWTTGTQVAFTIADMVVKLGFAGLIHRVAKLRTAEDVRAGDDIHPEAIWISSIKQSDAGLPVVVYLAPGAAIHQGRPKPATGSAVAAVAEAGARGIDDPTNLVE